MASISSYEESTFFNLQQAVVDYYSSDDYCAEVSFAYIPTEKRWWMGVSRFEHSNEERTIVVQTKHKDWGAALKRLVRKWLHASRTPPPQALRSQLQAFLKSE